MKGLLVQSENFNFKECKFIKKVESSTGAKIFFNYSTCYSLLVREFYLEMKGEKEIKGEKFFYLV